MVHCPVLVPGKGKWYHVPYGFTQRNTFFNGLLVLDKILGILMLIT